MKSDHDGHHLVTRHELRKAFGRNWTRCEEGKASDINVVFYWRKTFHVAYHNLFEGRTVMQAYAKLSPLFAKFRGERNRRGTPKMQSWQTLFGKEATIEIARRKLRFLIYYYLFGKAGYEVPTTKTAKARIKEQARSGEVLTPKELLGGLLDKIYKEAVLKSRFKKQAWQALFGKRATPGRVKAGKIRRVYASLDRFPSGPDAS